MCNRLTKVILGLLQKFCSMEDNFEATNIELLKAKQKIEELKVEQGCKKQKKKKEKKKKI